MDERDYVYLIIATTVIYGSNVNVLPFPQGYTWRGLCTAMPYTVRTLPVCPSHGFRVQMVQSAVLLASWLACTPVFVGRPLAVSVQAKSITKRVTPFQPHRLMQVLPRHPLADPRSRSSRIYDPMSTETKRKSSRTLR